MELKQSGFDIRNETKAGYYLVATLWLLPSFVPPRLENAERLISGEEREEGK